MREPSLPFFDDEPVESGGSPEPETQTPPPRPGTQNAPLTITQVNTAARDLLEEVFPDVWIRGEISNLKSHTSGHVYFSLKDDKSQINAVMFRSVRTHIRFKPVDGQMVLARGRVTLYEARGSYQINVQWMEPEGLGSLQLAFEQLKMRLKNEGLFDDTRKRPLPALPRRIAVVTSPTGAAIRDIFRVLKRRHAGIEILVAACRVQGEGASAEIVAAIENVNKYSTGATIRVDVMIVGRGGGSLEDLWAFNEEIVARAIARSDIPIISAVGHEVDFTIADFVADLRASTPSAAAEMVVMSREELLSRVAGMSTRLRQAARVTLLRRRARVDTLASSRVFSRVETSFAQARQRTDEALMRLGNELLGLLRNVRERLSLAIERLSPRSLKVEVISRRSRVSSAVDLLTRAIAAHLLALRKRAQSREAVLTSLSPLAVLDRGYAICQDPATGAVITDAARVAVGDTVNVRLGHGRIGAAVQWTEPEPRKES